MGQIQIDPNELVDIASSCRVDGENMAGAAINLQGQLARLQEALQGFPHMALSSQFDDMHRKLAAISDLVDEFNAYLSDVTSKAEAFVQQLNR